MLNNVKVEDSVVETGYSNWKNARSAEKGFQKHEAPQFHQATIQRLNKKTNLKQGIFVKKDLCLCNLARKGLAFRGHGYHKDSKLKQFLNFSGEDDLAFTEWLIKNKPALLLKLKMKC